MELIENYLSSKGSRGKKKKAMPEASARIYRHEISKFSAFLSALGKDLGKAGTAELDAYHKDMTGRNLKPASMKRAFSMITGFLKWQAGHNPAYHAPVSARGDLIKYSAPGYAESEHFQNLLEKFSGWIQTDKTRAAYLQPIYRFFTVCGKSPENIIHDDILNWVNRLQNDTREKYGRAISPKTIRLHLSAVSKFSRFLKLQGLPAVPSELLRKEAVNLPRQSGKQTPESLTPDELQTLFHTVRNTHTKIAQRDYALFSLTFCCALRAGEAVNLKTGHILYDREKVTVRIHGRKNKRDIIQTLEFTDKRDRKMLQTVKGWADMAGLRPEEPLFPWCRWDRRTHGHVIETGTRITVSEMEKRFWFWLGESGIQKVDRRIVVHSLRHTRATDLLKNRGMDLVFVRNFLGHANIATTDVYLH